MRDHTMGTMIRLGGILSVDEKMIADARLMSEETAASWGLKTLKGFGEWEANVIRIVACWNACNGLPTEKLEQHNIGYVIGEAERERGQAEPFLLEQIRKLEGENGRAEAAEAELSRYREAEKALPEEPTPFAAGCWLAVWKEAYDSLRAHAAAVTAERDALKHDIARHVQTCAELATECERLRGDAERYRWLRNDDNWEETQELDWAMLGEKSMSDFDDAIDAARGKK